MNIFTNDQFTGPRRLPPRHLWFFPRQPLHLQHGYQRQPRQLLRLHEQAHGQEPQVESEREQDMGYTAGHAYIGKKIKVCD